MVIYVCEDSLDGILCGVYDAWSSGVGHRNVKLETQGEYNFELFSEYREPEVSAAKAERVADSIRRKISEVAYSWVYRAAMSRDPEKADKIYRFLIWGFHVGKKVTESLQIPAVYEVFSLNRAVADEAHLQMEFLRFAELPNHVLFSTIGPKNDVTALLMPHFSDRLRSERFIIYDEKHQKAGVHTSGMEWFMLYGDEAVSLGRLTGQSDAGEYDVLWKAFFESIGIKERENYRCQRTHLPLRYRPYMTEFQK